MYLNIYTQISGQFKVHFDPPPPMGTLSLYLLCYMPNFISIQCNDMSHQIIFYLFHHLLSSYPDLCILILLRYFPLIELDHQPTPFYQIYTLQNVADTNDRLDIIHASMLPFLFLCTPICRLKVKIQIETK